MFDRRARVAVIIACLVMLIGNFGFRAAARLLNVFLTKEPVQLRQTLGTISSRLGDWQQMSRDQVLDAATEGQLGTTQYLNRTYRLEGGAPWDQIEFHMAYYTGGVDRTPHVPDRCFVAAGLVARTPTPTSYDMAIDRSEWVIDPTAPDYQLSDYVDPVTGRKFTVHLPSGDFILQTTEFQDLQKGDIRIFAGYFFIANNRITTRNGVLRLGLDPREHKAYYCKVQFTMFLPPQLNAEYFINQSTDLLHQALPQLMRCLPDWPAVESESETESQQSEPSET